MEKKVLITGATGATGGSAIVELLARGIPVRALVRKIDQRSDRLSAQGVEIARGDLSDFESVSQALKGITATYFVFPIQTSGILEATAFFAQAAIEQGVSAIVNMSQISARREAKSVAARNHWIGERLLDRSGIPVTHLRPTFFAEWLAYHASTIREKSVLPLPFGNGRYAPIAAEDQGRVIAAILADPTDHAGKVYPLFGPKEMDEYEIAKILSEILARPVTYIPMEIDAYKLRLKEAGYTFHFIQHVENVAQDCRDGIFAGTNELVEQITGRKPLTINQYIEKNRALFA